MEETTIYLGKVINLWTCNYNIKITNIETYHRHTTATKKGITPLGTVLFFIEQPLQETVY